MKKKYKSLKRHRTYSNSNLGQKDINNIAKNENTIVAILKKILKLLKWTMLFLQEELIIRLIIEEI